MLKVTPFGTVDAAQHASLFDPVKPVKVCYFGVEQFGWAMGFTQCVGNGKFFGGLFVRNIRVIEWDGKGDILFGPKTDDKFRSAFKTVYGQEPVMAQ